MKRVHSMGYLNIIRSVIWKYILRTQHLLSMLFNAVIHAIVAAAPEAASAAATAGKQSRNIASSWHKFSIDVSMAWNCSHHLRTKRYHRSKDLLTFEQSRQHTQKSPFYVIHLTLSTRLLIRLRRIACITHHTSRWPDRHAAAKIFPSANRVRGGNFKFLFIFLFWHVEELCLIIYDGISIYHSHPCSHGRRSEEGGSRGRYFLQNNPP